MIQLPNQLPTNMEIEDLFGGASRLPILLLTPRWSPIVLVDPGAEDLCFVAKDDNGLIVSVRLFVEGQLVQFSIPARQQSLPGAYEVNQDGSMAVFGLRKLGPGTWLLQPSVNIPGQIHAFVVLCGVPEPPPWDHCMEPLHGAKKEQQNG